MSEKLYKCIYERLYDKTKFYLISRTEAEKLLGKYYHFPSDVSKSILNELKKKGWISLVNRDTILLNKQIKETEFKW